MGNGLWTESGSTPQSGTQKLLIMEKSVFEKIKQGVVIFVEILGGMSIAYVIASVMTYLII